MAHVMVSKFCDHIPLCRQSRINARSGVHIDRSTLARWVGQGKKLLHPLLAALGRYVLTAEKLHADDTPVPVLSPGKGKTKEGRLWVYVRDDRPAAWFQYPPDREGRHPRKHVEKFRGVLQAVGYGGWLRLYQQGQAVEAPWWDVSTARSEDSVAAQALRRIKALYAIEKDIRGQPPDVRRAHRQARAGPLLQEYHDWLTGMLGRVSRKSGLAQAIAYSLTRWRALTRYRDDGHIEMDSSAAERALRGVAIGRGNFLFMGSDAGGERAAAMYSSVETAKLNGLDPETYLHAVLKRIAEHRVDRVHELLP